MAPEVARGEQQSYPADVWALGCTVVEMATGLSPWPNITQDPLSALYHIGFSGALPEIPDFLSDQAKDFLSQCLKRDPKERWSVAELLKHPFVIHNGPDHGPKSYTPTSILDQDIWETLEEARSHEAQERPIKSPNERIKELMVDSSSDKFPNWAWDDDWITVRNHNTNDDKLDYISSGLNLHLGRNIQPNIESGNLIVESNFSFLSIELLNCCKDTTCSTYSSKKKSDEIIKDKFIYYCMNINFSLSNHEEFYSRVLLPIIVFLASHI
ncbi:Mitogen-activated protein kinase kinase kinase 18 [Bienertia sinuspersici]